MPGCSVTREARGTTAWLSLSGKFEGHCAWELSELIEHERLPEIVLDFSQVTDFIDYGVAVVATAVLRVPDKRVDLRGLRQHQLRLFKYFGVDPVKLISKRVLPEGPDGLLAGVTTPPREVV